MRIIKKCISLLLCIFLICSLLPTSFAYSKTFTVGSLKDFETLAEKCTLDSWSKGRTVELTCDIDLSSNKNMFIPIFCGTFNGNGHKITGVNITKAGSKLGLFRCISKDGLVENLLVSGKIKPQGTKNYIGGIAGNNQGIIRQVSFSGEISGNNYIGGIAGTNSGDIISCDFSGTLSGEQFSGGITGYNGGTVLHCENNGNINTVPEDKKRSVNNIDTDIDSALEHIKTRKEDGNDEILLPGKSDMGGIAGLSSGILQGSTNYGNIGYQHIGYNIGGIAGRQSGYILGCENYGTVLGRKDVGGIVGQAEPYILLNSSSSSIGSLKNEFNKLSNMASALIDDTNSAASKISAYLSAISEYSGNATENIQTILNKSGEFIDGNIDKINAETATISNTASDLVPVCESLSSTAKDMTSICKSVSDSIMNSKANSVVLNDVLHSLNRSLYNFEQFSEEFETATYQLYQATARLENAVTINNPEAVNSAIKDIASAAFDIASSQTGQAEAIDSIISIIKNADSIGEIVTNRETLLKSLTEIANAYKSASKSTTNLAKNIKTVSENVEINIDAVSSSVSAVKEALLSLKTAMSYLSTGFDKLQDVLSTLNKSYNDDDSDDNIREIIRETAKNLKSLSYAFDDLSDMLLTARDALKQISQNDTLTFITLGDDFKKASDNLFESVEGISDELKAMRSCFDSERDILTGNLHKLNNQFNLVMNLLFDTVNDYTSISKKTSLSDYIVDISDENINSTVSGKVKLCSNYGEIKADRNTGGIVGTMSIEYASDPEDDIELPKSINSVYTTKAVIQSCINNGSITGKKDMTGGISGNTSLGILSECENYGDITSSSGDYTGGIAGRCDSTVRRCFSKGTISGRRYVGGIAGRCETMTDCKTIVTVEGDEYTGAITGEAENLNHLHGNGFVDFGLGAVDGISYEKFAKPYTYEELKKQNGIPKRFLSFTATFIADEKTVKTEDIEFGSETDRIKFPQIPDKKGCYGKWQSIDDDTVIKDIVVKAEYSPWITVLASEEKDENGKLALALCEGNFTDDAQFNVTEQKNINPVNHPTGKAKVYKVTVKNADINGNIKIRLLNKNKGNIDAYELKNSRWEKLKTVNRGKYVKTSVSGNDSIICVVYKPKSIWIYLIATGIILLLVATFFVIIKKFFPKITAIKSKTPV